VAVAMVFVGLPSTAWAYVDPGSGSMFLQLLLAGLLGALYTLKAYWRRIRNWLSGKSKDHPAPPEPNDP